MNARQVGVHKWIGNSVIETIVVTIARPSCPHMMSEDVKALLRVGRTYYNSGGRVGIDKTVTVAGTN